MWKCMINAFVIARVSDILSHVPRLVHPSRIDRRYRSLVEAT